MDTLIKVLGDSGSKTKTTGTTSFQIADHIIVDAGNIFEKYDTDTNKIEHVFISHSHFDHIVDLPFLIENGFTSRTKQLHIYGLKHTIEHIKKFMFNNYIWPDFSLIPLLTTGEKSIVFQEFEYYKTIEIDGVKITPFPANHIVPTAGFVIQKNLNNKNRTFIISGDTYKNDIFWKIINNNDHIKDILVEISFESALNGLAEVSKHLTPELLDEELNKLKLDDVNIYVYHIKKSSFEKIKEELKQFPNLKKYNVQIIPEEIK
jgi:cAMP phosphodiesterase